MTRVRALVIFGTANRSRRRYSERTFRMLELVTAMYSIIAKSILLLLASVIAGSFLTLQIVSAQGSSSNGLNERVAVVESRVSDNREITGQLRTEIANLRMILDTDRQKIEDIQSKVSVITGIGIGLSSIMMILQLVQTVGSFHRSSNQDHENKS